MMAPVINANQKQNSRYGETKIPPPSYICHRCNQPGIMMLNIDISIIDLLMILNKFYFKKKKDINLIFTGHYINNCPTNGDPSYDFHKVKKPTGIPKSFLTPVDNIVTILSFNPYLILLLLILLILFLLLFTLICCINKILGRIIEWDVDDARRWFCSDANKFSTVGAVSEFSKQRKKNG